MNSQSPDTSGQVNAGKTIWVFTPSRTDPKDLEFILVQRQKLLQDAVERIRESALSPHKHHQLFVGPRGSGKTHVVTLIVSRLSQDKELADNLRIAWLNEDETCTTLLEFLIKIQLALQKRYPDEYRADALAAAYDMKAEDAFGFVSSHLLKNLGARTLLIVAENLDSVFEELGNDGQQRFRAFIQENPKLSIVATAQRLVEDLSKRTSPFFGFFQTEHLKPLNVQEATELLQNIARLQGKDELVAFLSTCRGVSRVRALHHLSGGNHRIYIVLSQFITRDSIEALVEPFMKMVDELTPYYQERVRWLPPLQRKIVEYLCTREGTVPVKEIAKRLFATPQTVSSQLQDLREKGYVAANQRGRESLYEVSEPLMRICVEVKEIQPHQPLRLLVDFLRVWYDDRELKHRLGKIAPTSEACAYLESAIQKNAAEGSLRKQLFIQDLQSLVPKTVGSALREDFNRELVNKPEAFLLALESLREGQPAAAIGFLDEAIIEAPDPSTQADILLFRARLHSKRNDPGKEIADYSAVIGLPGVLVEQKVMALFNRGLMHGQAGDRQREIEDYTTLIDLAGAPVAQVARALVNRAVIYGQAGDTQRAIEDSAAVVGLAGAPVEQVAKALFNRGIIHAQAGDGKRAIEDFTAVVGHSGASVEQVAIALVNRGIAQGQAGDTERAIKDFTAVTRLPDAPVEYVARALVIRGFAHSRASESQRAIEDYTAVIELPGAPVEQVAKALAGRGVTRFQAGDRRGASGDFTAVVGLAGAPVEQVAIALVNRSVTHGQAGDMPRAIGDCTAVIGLAGAPVDMVARALAIRGLAYRQAGEWQRAIEDYSAVIGLPGAPDEQVAMALVDRGVTYYHNGRKQEARADFESLLSQPSPPLEKVVDSCVALAKLHFSDGRWSEGFRTLDKGLESGTQARPPYRTTASDLVEVVFSVGLEPASRSDKVRLLLETYARHQALPVLGEAVIEQIGSVFRRGKPLPFADNLEGWASAWEQAAENVPGFRLSIRLLRTAVNYLKAGGEDSGALLDLTAPERAILEQALGIGQNGGSTDVGESAG